MAGHLVVHCIVAQDVPTNGGAPPDLVGPRPTRRYATAALTESCSHVVKGNVKSNKAKGQQLLLEYWSTVLGL